MSLAHFKQNRNSRVRSVATSVGCRRGAALLEFAFVLPIMFMVILGSVDICNNIFTKQFLTEVSYQGALEATNAGITESELRDSITDHLVARNASAASIVTQGVDGTPFDLVKRGEMFEVVIQLSAADSNSQPIIVTGINLSARSVGLKP